MRILKFSPEPQNVGILLEDLYSTQRMEPLIHGIQRERVSKRPVSALERSG